jgi:hypothetical protein
MPSNPGEEPARKELIASGTFCSLTIKEESPVLKASGEKSSRDGEGCFFFNPSATSSLKETNGSSEDNNLTVPLILKSATFASNFLASDKCERLLEAVRI